MNKLGAKIAKKRKSQGMTQIEFAEKMLVTRQTVSRWEAGTAMPDIDKIGEIADILGVSCDYLLKDEADENGAAQTKGVGKLLKNLTGKTVQLAFFDEEADFDLFHTPCRRTKRVTIPALDRHERDRPLFAPVRKRIAFER